LANERTFLAWLRTSLALVAGAVALDALATDYSRAVVQVLAGALATLGAAGTVLAWLRWGANERAIRRGDPLPGFAAGAVASGALLVIAGAAAALVLLP
jgi:putative membrane protein